MKNKVFTLVFAFLAMAGNAIWGQETEIDISNLTTSDWIEPSPTPSNYSITKGEDNNNVLTITAGGEYIIKDEGETETTAHDKSNLQIKFNISTGDKNISITLKGVKINAYLDNSLYASSGTVYPDHCAMEIPSGITVTLNWEGENKLWSGGNRAGINVKDGATLIIAGPDTDENKLEVGSYNNSQGTSHTYGAGIGGDAQNPDFGTIIIKSGTVVAYSQDFREDNNAISYGAGIGGGYNPTSQTGSSKGNIQILGGNVTAESDVYPYGSNGYTYGAGIGGGYKGTVENIMITGGTVTGTSENGDDIGNGNSYSGTKPDVIIAPVSNETNTPTVTGTVGINVDKLQVNADKTNTTLTGTVAVQDGTQIYAPGISETTEYTIIAYNVKLINDKLEGDEGSGSHEAESYPAYISDTYYGKSLDASNPTTVTIPVDVTCTWNHLFIGWYGLEEGSSSEYEIKETAFSVDIPTTEPSSTATDIICEYTAVWVDNKHDIVVANLHEWKKDDASTNPPTISVTPQGAISLLDFNLNRGSKAGTRLDDVQLDDNVFTGTPALLVPNESYANLEDVTVTVKVEGSTGEGKIVETPIFIHSDNLVITGVTLKPDHTYDGYAHNNTRDDESGYHAFEFEVQVEDGIALPDGFTLTEGVHYVVEDFQVDGQDVTPEKDSKGSAQIIDAGEYSNIVLKSVTQEEDGQEYGVKFKIGDAIAETTEYTIPDNLTVKKRSLTLDAINPTITLPENSTEPDFTNYWQEYVEVNGIATVKGTLDDVTPDIKAKVNTTEQEWWTIPGTYTVTFTIESLSGTKAGNYQEEATASITIKVGSDKDDNTNDNIHIDRPKKYYHIYIDTVCPGLQLELSKDSVIEGGQVSVYLTVEEKCDTTGFTFEYKRGLKKWWQDLKPLEGVQPGEYIIKNIYSDIYIQALDAILEIEEEPTGIEDVEGAKVYAKEGTIYVYTPNHERVMIVSMNGAIVKSAEQEGMQSYSLNRGIYIVRIGDKVFKIKN